MLDQETGQMTEHHPLIAHKNPKIRAIWSASASNEMECLFQGVGKGDYGGQRTKGTDTFFLTSREKIHMKKEKTSLMLLLHAQ